MPPTRDETGGRPLYQRQPPEGQIQEVEPDMDEVTRRIGRRGAYLLASALLYGIYGVGLATFPDVEVPGVYSVLAALAPMRTHGWLWIAGAFAVAVTAFFQRDRYGFTIITLLAGTWALGTLLGAWTTHSGRAYIVGLLFAAQAVKHVIVAGMVERPIPRGVGGGRE